MPKHKKPSPGKKVALMESGHKANPEGKKIPMVGAGPDEKVKAMHEKQKHAPGKMSGKHAVMPKKKHKKA